jgi:hypothetical protein
VSSGVVQARLFLLGILIFKGLAARRLYKSFGIEGLSGSPVKLIGSNAAKGLKQN